MFNHKKPMDSPLGEGLKRLGFNNFWDYAESTNYSTVEKLAIDVCINNLAPIAVIDFARSTGKIDGNWDLAWRAIVITSLELVFKNSTNPSREFNLIAGYSIIVSSMEGDSPWIETKTKSMIDKIRAKQLQYPFAWNCDLFKNISAQQGDAPEPDSCRSCLSKATSRPGDL